MVAMSTNMTVRRGVPGLLGTMAAPPSLVGVPLPRGAGGFPGGLIGSRLRGVAGMTPDAPVGQTPGIYDRAEQQANDTYTPMGGFSIPDDAGTPIAVLPRLSGSGPSGFDYEAVRNALLPPEKQHSKTHNTLVDIARIAAPALMAMAGNEQGANAFIHDQALRRDARAKQKYEVDKLLADWQHDDWSDKYKAQLDASAPYTLGQGQSRYTYDPVTGQNQMIQHERPTYDEYAQDLGNTPGSDGYNTAAQDWVLRGNGPSALAFDQQLDNTRTANDVSLERTRQTGRERLRGLPTYRDTHPRPAAAPRGSGGRSAPTATGPNGEKVTWNGSAWVDAQGKPVQ